MKRNRYLLCLLICLWMIYYAVPRLELSMHGAAGLFGVLWSTFAFMVLAGNLSALLFTPARKGTKGRGTRLRSKASRKIRSYHG
jgi:hypothetical protein